MVYSGKSHKSFLNENKCMRGWNPQKPTKLDGNDTTIITTPVVPAPKPVTLDCFLEIWRLH